MKGFRPGKGEEMMAKKAQEEAEAKKKEFLERRTAFIAELEPLTVKYKIALIPVMEYRKEGVIPAIVFVDDPDAGKEDAKEENKAPEGGVKLEQR